MGAYDFFLKPFQKNQVLISVANAIRRRALDLQSQFEFKNLENIIYDQTKDLYKANERLKKVGHCPIPLTPLLLMQSLPPKDRFEAYPHQRQDV